MAEITEITKEKGTDSGDSGSNGGKDGGKDEIKGGAKFISASKVQQDADKLRTRRELPKPPGNVVKFPELLDWLKLLTDEMYDRLMIYVYRHDPIINRQFVDPNADNNIDVISGQGCKNLDEEYFIDRHAGGVYGLTIKDTDVIKKGDRGYFEARLSINPTQYPPKLDYREVDWLNTKNKGYFAWARAQRIVDNNGNLMEQGKKVDTGIGTQSQPESAVAVMKATMEMIGKMNESQQRDLKRTIGGEDAVNKPMTELLIAKMKEDSPNNMLPLLTTLITQMNKPVPAPVVQGDGGLAAISTMMTTMMTAMMSSSQNTITMMQESNKTTMTLLTTLLANQGKGDDEGERFKQMVEIAKMIKGAPAPELSVTERLIDRGMDLLGPVAGIIQNITGIKVAQAGGGIGMGQNNNPAGHPMTNQIILRQGTLTGGDKVNLNPAGHPNLPDTSKTLTEDFGGNQSPQMGVAGTLPVGVSPSQVPSDQAIINTINQYGDMILQALNAGKEGWEFADNIAGVFGDIVVQTVAKHGTDNLIRGMKLVPQFWGIIENSYGEAHMRKWCDEFINYKKIVAEMENDGDGDLGEGEVVETKE